MKIDITTICLLLVLFCGLCHAEEASASLAPMYQLPADSLIDNPVRGDSIDLKNKENSLQSEALVDTSKLKVSPMISKEKTFQKKKFIPSPQRALWLAMVLPGAGQIYNRKYWKLPIIYGGFLGCVYALNWNQQMYKDYSQAYLDIMDNDPNTQSYIKMLPPNYDITGKEDQFKEIFKNKKDYYRKYRDMSIFCFVGVYILSIIDAYVDAQLSVFDISKNLSLKVEPAVINEHNGYTKSNVLGLQCSLKF